MPQDPSVVIQMSSAINLNAVQTATRQNQAPPAILPLQAADTRLRASAASHRISLIKTPGVPMATVARPAPAATIQTLIARARISRAATSKDLPHPVTALRREIATADRRPASHSAVHVQAR